MADKSLGGIGTAKICDDGRKHFLSWCGNRLPRNNELFEVMKTSRAAFNNALKVCRRKDLRIKKTVLLSKFERKKT